jgi:hypothetical protein
MLERRKTSIQSETGGDRDVMPRGDTATRRYMGFGMSLSEKCL